VRRLSRCVLLALLLAAQGAAQARAAGEPPMPPGAPGAAAMSAATPFYHGLSYRGTISGAASQAWYRFESDGAERAIVEVWGRTASCPVRASVLDAGGHTLAQLISSSSEILPLLVGLRAGAGSDVYLRIDADPYRACASAGYVVTLFEPEDLPPCAANPHPTPECPVASFRPEPAPALVQRACEDAGATFARATVAVARERALIARGRGSYAALVRLEAERLASRRRALATCGV
jgi:hypothetical protein